MAVRKVGFDAWYSSLTEQTYDSEAAAKHYDNLERMKSSPESAGSKILEKLSTEELKSLVTEMNRIGSEATDTMDWQRVQQEFVDSHPEFFACPANGSALAALLTERGKLMDNSFLGTMQDMETAYYDLAERGMLLSKKGSAPPKRPFNEAEAYALPLAELERRGRGW